MTYFPLIDQDIESSAASLGNLLRQRGFTIAAAESCTGGAICSAFTSVAGSSQWFGQGFVTYSNQAKTQNLGVDDKLIDRHGAVSQAVAEAMLQGVLSRSGADVGIAVTGIAGPDGSSASKPVGSVWLAWGSVEKPCAQYYQFDGGRQRVRSHAVKAALVALIDWLKGDDT